jgi:hypothetical protein
MLIIAGLMAPAIGYFFQNRRACAGAPNLRALLSYNQLQLLLRCIS